MAPRVELVRVRAHGTRIRASRDDSPWGGRFDLAPAGESTGMGILDKITGRAKKAAGDLAGDGQLRREGRREERKGEAKEELAQADERADRKAEEVERLERQT
jgi:uncharacterized protein YjbJ (UPF0337 family)